MNKNIINLFLQKNNKKLKDHITKLSPEAREQEIKYENNKYTLLSLSILFQNNVILKELLKLKVNPNSNKYPNGIPYIVPISLCENKKQIDILILHGASINMTGLNQQSLLTNLIEKMFQTNKYLDLIHYLLSKGGNPNIPLYNLPLNKIINIFKKMKNFHIVKKKFKN